MQCEPPDALTVSGSPHGIARVVYSWEERPTPSGAIECDYESFHTLAPHDLWLRSNDPLKMRADSTI